MPAEAKENRIEDAILAALQTIVGGGSWLTQPVVAVGVPLDGIPVSTQPRIYLQFIRTEEHDEEGSTGSHVARSTWHVWCCSASQSSPTSAQRIMKNLKADVLRALFASEGTIQAAGASLGAWPGTFEYRPDLAKGGWAVGVFELVADYHLDHGSDP